MEFKFFFDQFIMLCSLDCAVPSLFFDFPEETRNNLIKHSRDLVPTFFSCYDKNHKGKIDFSERRREKTEIDFFKRIKPFDEFDDLKLRIREYEFAAASCNPFEKNKMIALIQEEIIRASADFISVSNNLKKMPDDETIEDLILISDLGWGGLYSELGEIFICTTCFASEWDKNILKNVEDEFSIDDMYLRLRTSAEKIGFLLNWRKILGRKKYLKLKDKLSEEVIARLNEAGITPSDDEIKRAFAIC